MRTLMFMFLLAGFAGVAHADVIYTYTGSSFYPGPCLSRACAGVVPPNYTGPLNGVTGITASLILPDYVFTATDLFGQVTVTPIDYSVSDGVTVLTPLNSTLQLS